MLKKRIIPCLDVSNGQVVKGVQFQNHEIVGDILELGKRYRDEGADELVFYDITASSDQRLVSRDWVKNLARVLDIPFCVAGGIRSVSDAESVLAAGADKISLNSPALENPNLITELAKRFGSQCVVVGVDSLQTTAPQNGQLGTGLEKNTSEISFAKIQSDRNYKTQNHSAYEVCQYTGSEKTLVKTCRRTLDWTREAQERGAGEVVLNCMNQDGMRKGYDIEQLKILRKVLKIPLIASGGAGSQEHFFDVFNSAHVDGALAASVFHKRVVPIPELKKWLSQKGIEVRL